jgi:hypothetical protein
MAPGVLGEQATLEQFQHFLAMDVALGPISDGFGEYLRLMRMLSHADSIRHHPTIQADSALLAEAEQAYEVARAAWDADRSGCAPKALRRSVSRVVSVHPSTCGWRPVLMTPFAYTQS